MKCYSRLSQHWYSRLGDSCQPSETTLVHGSVHAEHRCTTDFIFTARRQDRIQSLLRSLHWLRFPEWMIIPAGGAGVSLSEFTARLSMQHEDSVYLLMAALKFPSSILAETALAWPVQLPCCASWLWWTMIYSLSPIYGSTVCFLIVAARLCHLTGWTNKHLTKFSRSCQARRLCVSLTQCPSTDYYYYYQYYY